MVADPVPNERNAGRRSSKGFSASVGRKRWECKPQLTAPNVSVVLALEHSHPEPERETRNNLAGLLREPAVSNAAKNESNVAFSLFVQEGKKRFFFPPVPPKTGDQGGVHTIAERYFYGLNG